MSNEHDKFVEALRKASLPTDPKEVIGRMFLFRGRGEILAGRIRAIRLHEALELEVSNRRFYGDRLTGLWFSSERGWCAHTRETSRETQAAIKSGSVEQLIASRFTPGTFRLL